VSRPEDLGALRSLISSLLLSSPSITPHSFIFRTLIGFHVQVSVTLFIALLLRDETLTGPWVVGFDVVLTFANCLTPLAAALFIARSESVTAHRKAIVQLLLRGTGRGVANDADDPRCPGAPQGADSRTPFAGQDPPSSDQYLPRSTYLVADDALPAGAYAAPCASRAGRMPSFQGQDDHSLSGLESRGDASSPWMAAFVSPAVGGVGALPVRSPTPAHAPTPVPTASPVVSVWPTFLLPWIVQVQQPAPATAPTAAASAAAAGPRDGPGADDESVNSWDGMQHVQIRRPAHSFHSA
jgi:hypothetical protein